ncbi:MAG TPA: hypothetical protein VF144_05865 [Chitinophagaceae bacterium]
MSFSFLGMLITLAVMGFVEFTKWLSQNHITNTWFLKKKQHR